MPDDTGITGPTKGVPAPKIAPPGSPAATAAETAAAIAAGVSYAERTHVTTAPHEQATAPSLNAESSARSSRVTPPAPATQRVPDPAPAPTPTAPMDTPQTGGNEENKFRRLHEAEETKRKAAEARVAQLEAADAERRKAEMSEIERAKAEAGEAAARAQKAEDRAAAIERERLIERISAEHGLTETAREFLAGEDEAALRANAVKLAAIMKAPAVAGTITSPTRGGEPSLEERIVAAQKSGRTVDAIALKRQQAGLSE